MPLRHYLTPPLDALRTLAAGLFTVGVVSLLMAPAVRADDGLHQGVRFFPPTLTVDSYAPAALPLSTGSTVIIRYLGYRCSHCVEHLRYLNRYASEFRRLGVQIIATSPDGGTRWNELAARFDFDTSVMKYVSDPENTLAGDLGARPIVNDTMFDAHAAIVVRDGRVTLSVVSDQPYMDVERLVAHAVPPAPLVLEQSHSIDQYLSSPASITPIATADDGISSPLDLDFARSPLHENDLWVVTAEPKGHAIAVIHNAGTPQQVIRKKKDSRAYHFMWRTMGIAMGDNGSFATAQNGEPGNTDLNYMFIGPTLWSADTAVFASRYQEDDDKLASHLDMLHQSPWGLGIAHDSANIYWVLDARYKDICRYDFRDPHEVGGTDHRDGIIRRYSDVAITPAERGRPAHIDLDKSTGLLYYIDPGKGSVHVLDTKSGTIDQPLTPPRESSENLAEFVSMKNAVTRMVVKPGVISEPVGLEVYGNRLLVGDRATGKIHVFAINDTSVALKGSIATGATSLNGITVGPDARIWFVDNAVGMVARLDVSTAIMLSTAQRVRAIDRRDVVSVTITNGMLVRDDLRLRYRFTRQADGTQTSWSYGPVLPSLSAGESRDVEIPVVLNDSLSVWTCDVSIVNADGSIERSTTSTLVPRSVRKAVVNDELNGTFDIVDAVRQTERREYVAIPSDVFTLVANDLPVLKTVLWNAGSVGELSDVDDAVVRSLIGRQIEVFLIGDDPLLLRTDLPGVSAFFRAFGTSLRGVDVVDNDNGQRVLRGVLGDPVTAGMSEIDVQLPRLDHHRGGKYIPNVKFLIISPARGILTRADTVVCAVRNQTATYRSIIMGVNASRFLDGAQRTQILDKGLAWLEEYANPDTVDNPTSVANDEVGARVDLTIQVGANPVVSSTSWHVRTTYSGPLTVGLYSAAGQRVATIYEGSSQDAHGRLQVDHLPAGAYFLVCRSHEHVGHCTIIIR